MFLFKCINMYYGILKQFLNIKETCSCSLTKYSSKVLVCQQDVQYMVICKRYCSFLNKQYLLLGDSSFYTQFLSFYP